MGGGRSYVLIAYTPLFEFNVLFDTKIGFQYQFDFGLGISVFGEYCKGTRIMAQIEGYYNYSDGGVTTREDYITNGDYWNAGIGISYTFKNTRK